MIKLTVSFIGATVLAAVFLSVAPPKSQANPFVVKGPFVHPWPGDHLPLPPNVYGKEYSHHIDQNGHLNPPLDGSHAPNPGQVIKWDGAGGTTNSLNFAGSIPGFDGYEVDALAEPFDATLYSHVINNQTNLLGSIDNDPNIYYESRGGATGVWATSLMIDQPEVGSIIDLDGLNLWGPAYRFSLEAIPFGFFDPLGVAVWDYNPWSGLSTPVWSVNTLYNAIFPLAPEPFPPHLFNLDGMMNFGEDNIIFTIDPVFNASGTPIFFGGEIFTYTRFNPSASFLSHGGHLWDIAFARDNLMGLNINALEAASTIPEPTTMLLLGTGLVGVAGAARRRKKK